MSEKLGKMIAKRRKEAGKTVDEMARLLWVHPSDYRLMEAGIALVTLGTAAKIAKELKIKPYLMFQASLKG